MKARREGHELHVTVELGDSAMAEEGELVATVVTGDGSAPNRTATLHWEDAHRLGARLPIGASGLYFPIVQVGAEVIRAPPIALSYPPEFAPRDPREGRDLLEELARLTGGVERLSIDGLFTDGGHAAGRRPVGAWLVAFALILLLIEVLARRLGWQWPSVKWPTVKWPQLRPARVTLPAPPSAEPRPISPVVESESGMSAAPEAPVPEKRSAMEIARDRARRRLR